MRLRCVPRATCAYLLGSLRWVLTHLFFSSAGPATSVFESLASSIGAGLVVGGFAGGVRGFVTKGFSSSEEGAVAGGYAGAAVGLSLLLIDTLTRSFV